MITLNLNWDAKLGHPENMKPLNVDISDAIQHKSGLMNMKDNTDYGVNGRSLIDTSLNFDQVHAMVHFDQDWGENQVEIINLLGESSSTLDISGNITNLLPVWQEFQGNDGVSRIFPATILGLDSVDMRLESEYRNSYVYEENMFYFSPPKMDSRGMGLVVDVKKTVADEVSGVLGTFKNVYMLKQIEKFINGKIQGTGNDPLNHIIFNEYGRVMYSALKTINKMIMIVSFL